VVKVQTISIRTLAEIEIFYKHLYLFKNNYVNQLSEKTTRQMFCLIFPLPLRNQLLALYIEFHRLSGSDLQPGASTGGAGDASPTRPKEVLI